MVQEENKSLEYYEKIFHISYKTHHNYTLDEEYLRLVLHKVLREYLMETSYLIENGDIIQLNYEYIKKVFKI